MLVHEVQGPVSFEEYDTDDGIFYTTYRESCD